MKIIDFYKKGNVVRFYLGRDECNDYTGDDWDDRPYEHNAGTVYDEYIEGVLDVAFPFDWDIMEPADDWSYRQNSPFCKDDFKARNAPCIVAVPAEESNDGMYATEYSRWVASDNVMKIFFGDNVDTIRKCKYADEMSITWTI